MHYIEVYFSPQYEFAVSPDSSIIESNRTTFYYKQVSGHRLNPRNSYRRQTIITI